MVKVTRANVARGYVLLRTKTEAMITVSKNFDFQNEKFYVYDNYFSKLPRK